MTLTLSATADANGNFAITVPAGNALPAGAYTIRARQQFSELGQTVDGPWTPYKPFIVGPADPDADALVASFAVAPSLTRKAAIETCIKALKLCGAWSKIGTLWMLDAHTEQAALRNWKTPGTGDLVKVGEPPFAANRGFTGGQTGIDAVALDGPYWAEIPGYTTPNHSYGDWVLNNVTSDISEMGRHGSGAQPVVINARSAGGDLDLRSGSWTIRNFPVPDSIGMSSVSRLDVNGFKGARNKSKTAFELPADMDAVQKVRLLANGPVPTGAVPRQLCMAWVGAGLTDAEWDGLYDAALAYHQHTGAVA